MKYLPLTFLALAASAFSAPTSTMTLQEIALAGETRWDYVHVDTNAHRLFIAHSSQVDVVDTRTHALVGQLTGAHGVHGTAVAEDLGRVFISNGADGTIGVYALDTLQRLQSVRAGTNPDAIAYDPATQRVAAFNGRSHDITLADARTGEVIAASIPAGGEPEFAVGDGRGRVYFNVEDTSEIAVLDMRTAAVVQRYAVAPCEAPTGLTMDPAGRLYSVCGNGVMVISDPASGRILGQAKIGRGADGVAWLDGHAISANGRDGTITVVAEVTPEHFEAIATLPTAYGARTIAVDPALHELYLPTADFKPEAAPQAGQPTRPAARREALPGTFKLLVLSHL